MHLGKAGYYADFVVYPVLLLPLGAVVVWGSTWQQQIVWTLACLIGIAGWTLLEYVMHRVVLHHIPPLRGMHDLHHATPTAMIGTPTWVGIAFIGGGVLLPLWWQVGLNISSGLTFGLILGYLWYVLVHHAIHHRRTHHGSYLYRAKRRHHQHNHLQQACNFGVTTGCWDRLFGSASSREYGREPSMRRNAKSKPGGRITIIGNPMDHPATRLDLQAGYDLEETRSAIGMERLRVEQARA